MALINTQQKEYYKINKNNVNLDNNEIVVEEYKNKEHRQDGDSKWLTHLEYTVHLNDLAGEIERTDLTSLGEKNYKNVIVKVAYAELKKLEPYSGFEDC